MPYDKRPFECEHCFRKFRCEDTRHRHLEKEHGYEPVIYECHKCPKKFKFKKKLLKHIAEGHEYSDIRFECGLCPSTFKYHHHFERHKKMAHDPTRTYECKDCFKTFARRDNFIIHLKMEHAPNCVVHKCKECHKIYKSKAGLKLHYDMNHVTKVPRSKCPFCPSDFKWPQHLKQHMSKVHFRQSYAPKGKVTDDKNLLYQNNRCVLCMVPFKCKFEMLLHLRCKHKFDIDIYKCCQCTAVFTIKEPLKIHIKTEHPESFPHKCVQCYPVISPQLYVETTVLTAEDAGINEEVEDFEETLMDDEQLRLYVKYKIKHIKTNQLYTKEGDAPSDETSLLNDLFDASSRDSEWNCSTREDIDFSYHDSTYDINPQLVCEVTIDPTPKDFTTDKTLEIPDPKNIKDVSNQISNMNVYETTQELQTDENNEKTMDIQNTISPKKNIKLANEKNKQLVIQIERIDTRTSNDKGLNTNKESKILTMDVSSVEDVETTSKVNDTNDNSKQHYRCTNCNESFKLQKTLNQHMRFAHSSEKIKCKHCTAIFVDLAALQKHEKDIHLGESLIFKCDACNKLYPCKSSFDEHCEIHKEHSNKREFQKDSMGNAEEETISDMNFEISILEGNKIVIDVDKSHVEANKGLKNNELKSTKRLLESKIVKTAHYSDAHEEILTDDVTTNLAEHLNLGKTGKENSHNNHDDHVPKLVINNKCDRCNKTIKNENTKHTCKKIKCKHCKVSFYKVLDVARHVKLTHIIPAKKAVKNSVFKCKQAGCMLTFTKVIEFARHMKLIHKRNSTISTNQKSKFSSTNQLKFKCKRCDKMFESVQKLAIHTRYNHLKRRNCKNKRIKRKLPSNIINVPTAIENNVNDPFYIENYLKEQFNINRYNTPSPISDSETTTNKVPEKSYECGKCVLFFPSKLELLRHISDKHMYIPDVNTTNNNSKMSKKVLSYQCDHCKKKFSKKRVLTKHLLMHKAKFYSCISCSEIFKRESAYQEHVKTKHQNKCGICNINFVRQEKLYIHMQTQHSVKKSHKCTKCDAEFKLEYSLARHMDELHTPKVATLITNPKLRLTSELKKAMHKCQHCNALFPLQASLQRHIEWQHSNGRGLHKCGQCIAIFNDIEELVEHMHIEHRSEDC